MQKGDAALKTRRYQEALDAYKEASNAAGKKSARALLGVARAYHGLAAFKSEADTCADALKLALAAGDQALESTIHNQRGLALLDLARSTDKPALVKDAEASFRAALALPNPPPINWFNLGVALMRQGRDDEGVKALETFVTHPPAAIGPTAKVLLDDARKMIENPNRARVTYAPDYAFADMSGEYISSKELLGKTVLLDFWGTWCGPCVVATPTLVNLNRKFLEAAVEGRAGRLRDAGHQLGQEGRRAEAPGLHREEQHELAAALRSDAADPPALRSRRLPDLHRRRRRGHHPRSHGGLERVDVAAAPRRRDPQGDEGGAESTGAAVRAAWGLRLGAWGLGKSLEPGASSHEPHAPESRAPSRVTRWPSAGSIGAG